MNQRSIPMFTEEKEVQEVMEGLILYGLHNVELSNEGKIIAERLEGEDEKTRCKVWSCHVNNIVRKFRYEHGITGTIFSKEHNKKIKEQMANKIRTNYE